MLKTSVVLIRSYATDFVFEYLVRVKRLLLLNGVHFISDHIVDLKKSEDGEQQVFRYLDFFASTYLVTSKSADIF